MAQEGLGRVDREILRGAKSGKSFKEISAMTGNVVSAVDVGNRLMDILEARNPLTEAQREMLLLDDMHALREVLVERAVEFKDLSAAPALSRVLRDIGTRIDKRSAATKMDLNTLYGNMGQLMAHAYDIALSYMKGALRSEIDPEVWDALQKEALQHARTELAKHEAIEA